MSSADDLQLQIEVICLGKKSAVNQLGLEKCSYHQNMHVSGSAQTDNFSMTWVKSFVNYAIIDFQRGR